MLAACKDAYISPLPNPVAKHPHAVTMPVIRSQLPILASQQRMPGRRTALFTGELVYTSCTLHEARMRRPSGGTMLGMTMATSS